MKLIARSIRNVLRNPLRMILVIALLGISLMFVAAMMSLSANSQQEIAAVHKKVGTSITVNYATNEARNAQQSGGPVPNRAPIGEGAALIGNRPPPHPNSADRENKKIPGG